MSVKEFPDRQAYLPGMPAFFFLLPLVFLLFSCAVESTIPDAGCDARLIPDVPFFAQQQNRCGPASLAGVMNFWKFSVSQAELERHIFSDSAGGTLTLDMELYPQRHGFAVEQYSGGMADLRKHIDEGHPLIVLVDNGVSVWKKEHFMVVTGYDCRGIFANSGSEEKKFIPENEFLKRWEKTNFWALLITRKDQFR